MIFETLGNCPQNHQSLRLSKVKNPDNIFEGLSSDFTMEYILKGLKNIPM